MKNFLLPFSLAALLALAASCSKGPLALSKDNIDEVVKALTIEEKVHLLVGTSTTDSVSKSVHGMVPGAAGTTYPVDRLGIPALVFADGPNGVRIDKFATCFPVGTLLASTWNVALAEEEGAAIGEEALSYGIDVMLAPGINLHRNPLNGRNFEYYSEDPLVTGLTAAAYVRGIQKKGVGTSVKHFAVNSQELNRLANDARVSDRALRELYLKGFEIAVKESSPWTLMSSYNRFNGKYACENPDLLTGVLRGEWGFDGIVMSDWGAGVDNAAMILAGNENIQNGSDGRYEEILEAVRSGRISEEALDISVRRLLSLVVKAPHFRKDYAADSLPDFETHLAVARRIAEEGIVLLKNEGAALPVKVGKVAVFGSAAYDWIAVGGGAGDVNSEFKTGILEGLRESGFTLDQSASQAYEEFMEKEGPRIAALRKEMGHWRRASVRPDQISGLDKVVTASVDGGAESAIIVIGRQANEGIDRLVDDDFNLTQAELQMIHTVSKAYHASGKKVTVVLNTCCAVEVASWRDEVDAIVEVWLPGQVGGYALADILCGKVTPSGRLSMSFPVKYEDVPSAANFPVVRITDGKNPSFYRFSETPLYERKDIDYTNYEEGIYVGYRHYCTAGVRTAYPFGYGLSYTTFDWSDVKVTANGDSWTVECRVTNTGSYDGREVVQLYASAPQDAGIDMPERELRGYAKSRLLAPGESQIVTIEVSEADLASFSEQENAWVTAPGIYRLRLAGNAEDEGVVTPVSVDRRYVKKCTVSFAPEGDLFIL